MNLVYSDSMTPVSSGGFRFSGSREYPTAVQDFEKSFAFLNLHSSARRLHVMVT